MGKADLAELLGAIAAAAFAAGAIALVWADVLRTGHSALRDAVSDYGASSWRLFYWALVVSLSIGATLLLVALAHGTEVARGGLIWLGVYAVSRFAIAFFPTDLPGQPVTPRGRVHVALAAAAFAAVAFAAYDLSPELQEEPGFGAGEVIRVLGWAVVASAVATLVVRVVLPLRRVAFGAVERLLYASSIAWLVTVAVDLAA